MSRLESSQTLMVLCTYSTISLKSRRVKVRLKLGGFVVHLVVEEVVATLKAEIERRQREMEYIDPDQLIFMIK